MPQGTPVAGASPGHESNRIGLRGLLIFAVALILTVAVVQVVLGLVMKEVENQQKPTDQDASVRHAIAVDQFPTPRLQPNPMAELDQMKEEERQPHRKLWMGRPQGGIAAHPGRPGDGHPRQEGPAQGRRAGARPGCAAEHLHPAGDQARRTGARSEARREAMKIPSSVILIVALILVAAGCASAQAQQQEKKPGGQP